MAYHWLNSWEKIKWNLNKKQNYSHRRKWIWKYYLQNDGYLVWASMYWYKWDTCNNLPQAFGILSCEDWKTRTKHKHMMYAPVDVLQWIFKMMKLVSTSLWYTYIWPMMAEQDYVMVLFVLFWGLFQCPIWHLLSEPMMVSLLTHTCVMRPQWVKILLPLWNLVCSLSVVLLSHLLNCSTIGKP